MTFWANQARRCEAANLSRLEPNERGEVMRAWSYYNFTRTGIRTGWQPLTGASIAKALGRYHDGLAEALELQTSRTIMRVQRDRATEFWVQPIDLGGSDR